MHQSAGIQLFRYSSQILHCFSIVKFGLFTENLFMNVQGMHILMLIFTSYIIPAGVGIFYIKFQISVLVSEAESGVDLEISTSCTRSVGYESGTEICRPCTCRGLQGLEYSMFILNFTIYTENSAKPLSYSELGILCVIFTFCGTLVSQNPEITRKIPSSAY